VIARAVRLILHRDHRLRSKVPQQRDLLVRERPHFLALRADITQQLVILSQWHHQHRADARDLANGAPDRVVRGRKRDRGDVGHVNETLSVLQALERWEAMHWKPVTRQRLVRFRISARSYRAQILAITDHQRTQRSAAESVGLFQYCIEHRREVARRGIDDLQYLGGRCLLLQRFAGFGQEPGVLHCDDRLRSEILQQRDLLVRKRANLPTPNRKRSEELSFFAQRRRNLGSGAAQPQHG
jgi:hypothetical protein